MSGIQLKDVPIKEIHCCLCGEKFDTNEEFVGHGIETGHDLWFSLPKQVKKNE